MNSNKDKIGILGGTFNPIHKGHIQLAKAAYEQFDLQSILVMPSGQPSSYKDTTKIASAKDRCAMIELAIKDYPYMSLATLEIQRPGATYTSDTLRQMQSLQADIYFIIGADSLFMLDKWHEAEFVMANCTFLAADRDRHMTAELERQIRYLKDNFGADIELVDMDDIPISSSAIREQLQAGEDVSDELGLDVYRYICEHNLYRS